MSFLLRYSIAAIVKCLFFSQTLSCTVLLGYLGNYSLNSIYIILLDILSKLQSSIDSAKGTFPGDFVMK